MNTFKRKSLYAALAGVSALGVTGAANAVNISSTGIGEVLIYPYYTTRADTAGNAYNTLLTVVNTGFSAVSAKVRFLEGKNSREVLDFNLFLSPFDVWTAAIGASASGGAKIVTTDTSCTLPAIPATGKDFVNFAYLDDKAGVTLDRTKEGYIEIIEMSTYGPPNSNATAYYVLHINGVPNNCGAVTDNQASIDSYPMAYYGTLMGGATLVNVTSGTDYTEEPTVLQAFNFGPIYAFAGTVNPTLEFVQPKRSFVFENFGVVVSDWPTGPKGAAADPVSALLMHREVLNEYVINVSTKSGTDWVVTFPTKNSYVNTGTGSAPRLFQRNFNGTAGSCDDVYLYIFDREERTVNIFDFSPPPPNTSSICWEANVVTFNNSNVLGSTNSFNLSTTFENGWLVIAFRDPSATTYHRLFNAAGTTFISLTSLGNSASFGLDATYFGLPVIGFSVNSFSNGTLVVGGVNVLSNYGGNFMHKYRDSLSVGAP